MVEGHRVQHEYQLTLSQSHRPNHSLVRFIPFVSYTVYLNHCIRIASNKPYAPLPCVRLEAQLRSKMFFTMLYDLAKLRPNRLIRPHCTHDLAEFPFYIRIHSPHDQYFLITSSFRDIPKRSEVRLVRARATVLSQAHFNHFGEA